MKPAKTIESGKSYEHCNLGLVKVIIVEKRGVLVWSITGREGNQRTTEHRVAKRDLYDMETA